VLTAAPKSESLLAVMCMPQRVRVTRPATALPAASGCGTPIAPSLKGSALATASGSLRWCAWHVLGSGRAFFWGGCLCELFDFGMREGRQDGAPSALPMLLIGCQ
jgi:hypothetical protein